MLQQKKKDDLNDCFKKSSPVVVGIFLGSVNTFIKTAVDIAGGSSFQNFFLNCLLDIRLGN